MANRVLLNASGLKVSKPGQNVLTAGPGQLQFSSDWSQLALAFSGQYTVSWDNTDNDTGFFDHTISLGKTYPSPPFVCFQQIQGSTRVTLGGPAGFIFEAEDFADPDIDWIVIRARVTTTQIIFDGDYAINSGRNLPILTPTYHYTVFDYNI